MSRQALLLVALVLLLAASSWWATGQVIRWRDLEIEAVRVRADISRMVEQLKRLPPVPPSLPGPDEAQQILASLAGPSPKPGYSVRTSLRDRPLRSLGFTVTLTTANYQGALDEIDRIHGHDPAAVTALSIARGGDGLQVTLDGYIAISRGASGR